MCAPLIYVVGPSGSGKDSLMRYALEQLSGEPSVCFAHRYITRAANAGGENHVALTPEEFEARRSARLFALHWFSHGFHYGIGIEINQWLAKGITVVMNGSRAHLPVALTNYPEIVPVLIDAPEAMLQERLLARRRETAEQVEDRLRRNQTFVQEMGRIPAIQNDGSIGRAGEALTSFIRRHIRVRTCE